MTEGSQPGREAGALPRALRFSRETIELIADDVRPIDAGFVVRSPSLPNVWVMNHVRITEPVSSDEALALADEHLADLCYRELFVEDEQTGQSLEQSLRGTGWKIERDVLMALGDKPRRTLDTTVVIDADEDRTLELMRQWFLEGPPKLTPADVSQLVEYSRREARARGDRNFGVVGDGGGLVAMTKLRSDGATAQVEDVYTVPEARRRGYARALVSHAVAQARSEAHDLIFITADDNDWPKHLYAQIGFAPIGWAWAFHRGP